jgi:hypothetical protein
MDEFRRRKRARLLQASKSALPLTTQAPPNNTGIGPKVKKTVKNAPQAPNYDTDTKINATSIN